MSEPNVTRVGWQQKRASALGAAKRLERIAAEWPEGHIPKARMQCMAKELRQFADIADQWQTNLRKHS